MPYYQVTVKGDHGRLAMDWHGVATDRDKAAEAAELAYRQKYPVAETLRLTTTRIEPSL